MRPLFIGGNRVDTPDTRSNINPSNLNDVIDHYCVADAKLTERAIDAAVEAFSAWSVSDIQLRHDVLRRTADEIFARRHELGNLLSREEGKTLKEGIAEVTRAANIFWFFAGEALRATGEIVPSVRSGATVEITREPVGVIGIISPWNFPIAIPAWKIAPALCYGNTVVFKPAELVPGCAWEVADILHRAGLPAGVLNFVYGPGSVVGQAILDSPKVNAVSFTGSVDTGKRVAEACARHMRRCQLEMGGKNPLVVLDDADLENAVECAIDGSYFSTGQRCTASSRLIVTEGIYSRFVEACVDRLNGQRIGDARDPNTTIGPVVDQSQLDQDIDYIELGRREGANLRWGGLRLSAVSEGFYLQPALFIDSGPHMRINREEIFGPVASVIRARNYEEALSLANDTPFGLTAGICTSSFKHVQHFKRHAQAGMVMVNMPTAGVDFHVPFGGSKGSSLGQREQGTYAREFFTQVKTSYQRP
ncbi:aldehyde dehydrogenase family protein [Agrobacterium sp. NPDC058088]|uniref:aldehyde dehydrogenase family protein n=1 Tax=Agrobacterium sp. NPDC058088 TaxID=3346335 RepID=UPI0036D77DDE